MRRKCKYSRYLSAFIDGEMTEERAEPLRLHVEKCEVCREIMLLSLQLDGQLQKMPEIEPSEEFDRAFRRRLEAQKQKSHGWTLFTDFFKWRPVVAAAAVLVVLVSGVLIYRGAFVSPIAPKEIQIASNLDLYENYDMIQHLDLLENLNAIIDNNGPS